MSWTHLRQLDERAIRYFAVVCEEQSVRAAAERLRIAPSAVARKLKELEADLGIVLLTRTSKGVSPTALGVVFLEYVTRRHRQDSEIISHLLELTRLKRGEIRVALGEAFLLDFVTSATARFRQKHPEICFIIQVMNTEQIMQSLEENITDIGLAFNPPDPQSAITVFERTSNFSCIVPRSWHGLDGDTVSVSQLSSHPCGLLSRDFSARRMIDAAERAAGVRLQVAMETNSLYALKQFVYSGLGPTLLPDFAISPKSSKHDIRHLAVSDELLNRIPVRAFISNLGKDHPTTMELISIMDKHMDLFCDANEVKVHWPLRNNLDWKKSAAGSVDSEINELLHT
ncbi:LysR family transcriptional regulator [Mesorhizobium argentiipisi]|uniref:LysR family transcriptional regulator n=1 Tax=Mesorhizobium argentiipisi TaxID=3015175 RepID=A0ABU8KA58_9HYPH